MDTVGPAAVEDTDPLEGEGSEGGLVLHAARFAPGVECVGPEGARDGLSDPFDEGLAEEGGAPIAPVDGGLVAAAFGDGSDAGVLLERGGVWEALAALAKGDEEAWGERCSGAREGAKERVVGQSRSELADLVVEAVDGGAGGAELRKQDFDEQPVGLDGSSCVGGQRQLFSDGRDAAIDGVLVADVVAPEEGGEGLVPSTLSELEGGPALDEVSEDGSLFVAKPVEDLRKVGLQGGGDTIGEPDAVLDQSASSLDEASQRPHGHALGLEAGELVRMAEEKLEGKLGVGGVVLGAAGGEGLAVAGEGLGLDGEEHEEVVLEERGDDRPLG